MSTKVQLENGVEVSIGVEVPAEPCPSCNGRVARDLGTSTTECITIEVENTPLVEVHPCGFIKLLEKGLCRVHVEGSKVTID